VDIRETKKRKTKLHSLNHCFPNSDFFVFLKNGNPAGFHFGENAQKLTSFDYCAFFCDQLIKEKPLDIGSYNPFHI